MADISILSRLVTGIVRNVDIASNTLVVNEVKVGGASGTILTKTILDNLVTLQDGSDVTLHTHDTRYFTETEIGSSTASSGSDLIGDDNSYSNFTPGAATVKGALSGIDTALATAGGTVFADDVFRIEGSADGTKEVAFEVDGLTTATTRTITMPDTNVNLGDIATNTSHSSGDGSDHQDVADIVTLSGSAANSTNHGAFSGSTLSDTSTTRAALQALETAVEARLLLAGGTMAGAIAMGTNKITGLGTPTLAADAATKAYVDSLASGLDPKESVHAATTTTLDLSAGASKYVIGDITSGQGITNGVILTISAGGGALIIGEALTVTSNSSASVILATDNLTTSSATKIYVNNVTVADVVAGAFTTAGTGTGTIDTVEEIDFFTADAVGAVSAVDGQTLAQDERLLVKDESDAKQNGIYDFDVVGTASLPWALRRSADQDGSPASEVSSGNYTFVETGTANAGSGWNTLGSGVLTLNTDNLDWSQFSSAGAFTASLGVELSGSNFQLDLLASGGLKLTGNEVGVEPANFAGTGLEDDGSDNMRLATQGNGISGGAGSTLSVNADTASTTTTEANAIAVGANGVSVKVDDSSIEGSAQGAASTENLRVKALGITNAMLAGSIATTKMSDSAELAESVTFFASTDLSAAEAETLSDGSNADTLHNHASILEDLIAGETLPSGLKAVRYAKAADAGFVAGRAYLADRDATSADDFHVAGLVVAAGEVVTNTIAGVVKSGKITATAHGFTVGEPIFLGAAGVLTSTATSTVNLAVVKVGMARDANTIDVQIQVMGVN